MTKRSSFAILLPTLIALAPILSLAEDTLWDFVVGDRPAEALVAIANGDKLKSENFNGSGLTHFSARFGQVEVLTALLDAGMKIDVKNSTKSTPLLIAVGYDHVAAARVLMDRGANLNHQNMAGFTPVHLAAINSNHQLLVDLIERGADINTALPTGATPLHSALAAGDMEVAMALIEHGASVSDVTQAGDTSLHWAVAGGNIVLVERLLDLGALVNAENNRGETPFLVAAALDRRDIALSLLDRGAEFIANIDGSTPLHFAAGTGSLELVEALMAKWPYPNETDREGWTPTLIASDMHRSDVVDALAKGQTTVTLSRQSGSTSAASATFLLGNGAHQDLQLAKQYLLLAKAQFAEEAASARKEAESIAKWSRAGEVFGAALWAAARDFQQQGARRQMHEVLALNIAAETGGGYGSYLRIMNALEKSPNLIDVQATRVIRSDEGYDVGMYLTDAAVATARLAEVEALLNDRGWPTSEISSLESTDPPEFMRGDGMLREGTAFCRSVLPSEIRSITGSKASGLISFGNWPTLEDHYEQELPPVNFLWEVDSFSRPSDIEEAECAKAVFIKQCQVARDWIDEIRSFENKCL
jgi:ankyrin repeat protein